MMLLFLIYFLGLLTSSNCQVNDVPISDTLRVGFEWASRLLNARGNHIVDSVVKNLHKLMNHGKKGSGERETGLLMLLKLMGIDSSKLEDYALNGIVSVAHLISLVLTKNEGTQRKQRASKDFSPFDFIVSQPRVIGMLTQMQDPNIVDLILKEARDKLEEHPEEDVECVQLLVCKVTPFVRGMQKSLRFFLKRGERKDPSKDKKRVPDGCRNREEVWRKTHEEKCQENEEWRSWEQSNLEDRMYFFIPSLQEVIEFGDKCDLRFPNCVY